MPHEHNNWYAAQVGPGKSENDVVCIYDRVYGEYKDFVPAVRPGAPHKQIPSPFKLGGK